MQNEEIHRQIEAWCIARPALGMRMDADALVDIFHPDVVWPWPPNPQAHDPIEWVLVWGRYDR